MKNLLVFLAGGFLMYLCTVGDISDNLHLKHKLDSLTMVGDMYQKSYLKCNTQMLHINDSIKAHCLCR